MPRAPYPMLLREDVAADFTGACCPPSPSLNTPTLRLMDANCCCKSFAVARILLDRMGPDGHLVFYTGSFAFPKAEAFVKLLEREGKIERSGTFKTLLVCRKVG